jgi:hypothetical protein
MKKHPLQLLHLLLSATTTIHAFSPHHTPSPRRPTAISSHEWTEAALPLKKRKIELTWCNHGECAEALREQVVGEHNHIELGGPATGQVVYSWEKVRGCDDRGAVGTHDEAASADNETAESSAPAVLFLVKQEDVELAGVAADTMVELMRRGVQVLVDDVLANDLAELDVVDLDSDLIRLFRPKVSPLLLVS